jgi:Glycosyltransferase family 87
MKIARSLKRCLGLDRDLRSRLWRGGGLLAVFMWTMFAAKCVSGKDPLTWKKLGHDFLAFYYGGKCALTGHYEQLYDLSAARAFEQGIGHAAGLSIGDSFGPWWNPPFAAWLFAPFAAFPYLQALHLWWIASLIALAISIWLMCGMLGGDWKTRGLAPFLILTAMFPCFQAFGHGQNTFFSLLLLTATVWLWRREKFLWAGMVCGLLFYKPQLGAVVAVVLCLSEGRRALLGVCITGTALVLINVLTMPGTLHEFAYQMPLNIRWIEQQNVYHWDRHVTLTAFWRQAIQGKQIGPPSMATQILWGISETALLGGLGALLLAGRRSRNPASRRDRLISAAIVAMPLLMPFYFDYDLLLVSVGIVVYVADRQRELAMSRSAQDEDRWLVRMLIIFYAGLQLLTFLNEPRINPTVVLLAVLAVMLIRRGLRPATYTTPPAAMPELPHAAAVAA